MIARNSRIRKAPFSGAFFLLLVCQQLQAGSCQPQSGPEPVKVRYVHDGDTLTLNDNRKIRLIGINTPELARGGDPDQPLALQARNRLRQLLFEAGNRAYLLPGKDPTDPHGRTLANLWLDDDRNLTALMLGEGLGWLVAMPPNIDYLECYRAAEQGAREDSKGVWGRPAYQPRASTSLDLRDTRGFMRVEGMVTRVARGGGALWINLEGRFAVRIADRDLKWFPTPPRSSWTGREIQVQGWVYPSKAELRMNLHHPAAMRLEDTP